MYEINLTNADYKMLATLGAKVLLSPDIEKEIIAQTVELLYCTSNPIERFEAENAFERGMDSVSVGAYKRGRIKLMVRTAFALYKAKEDAK